MDFIKDSEIISNLLLRALEVSESLENGIRAEDSTLNFFCAPRATVPFFASCR